MYKSYPGALLEGTHHRRGKGVGADHRANVREGRSPFLAFPRGEV